MVEVELKPKPQSKLQFQPKLERVPKLQLQYKS